MYVELGIVSALDWTLEAREVLAEACQGSDLPVKTPLYLGDRHPVPDLTGFCCSNDRK
jgi:hypothetical protein